LYLSDNKLSGSIPSSIGNLVNLTGLELSFNKLSGSIPSSLGNLVNLTDLQLYQNQLSGEIPPSLGNLENLVALYLMDNQLSGEIPSSLGNLVNLTDLELVNNQLSGSIPSSLGNLVNLQYLRLSNNQLSGAIPSSIAKLSRGLVSLDLSYNRFTFNGMELIAQTFPHSTYSNQALIPVHQNGNALSVSAGGTLSNNTYRWYPAGNPTTIKGDSVFHPSQNGKYSAKVTNSIATHLTLYTDTIDYSVALPVTIINLEVHQQGSIIKVDWTSLTEINVAGYSIQRSANAVNYTAIGYIQAKGNDSKQADYSYNDAQPLQGANFYRLEAFDKDGKTTYSNTASVNISNGKTVTLVYPLPAKDILYVETNNNTSFSLLNQWGQILLTTNINHKGSINISGMATGLYYLKNNTTSTVQKVVISK